MLQLGICFRESAKVSRTLKAMVVTAMLIALNLILDRVRIQISPELRIGVGFLTSAIIGMMFGPVMGMIAGGLTDILSLLFYPTGAYFPGFTVTAIFAGFVYGVVLFKAPRGVTILRALIARGTINLFGNILLNTLWLSMIGGDAFWVLLPARFIKNIVMLPFEVLLLYAVAKVLDTILKRAHWY